MSSEGCAAHPVGIAALQIVIAIWRTFFKFELEGSGVGAHCSL
jgi:hypothetical protein